MSEEIPMSEDAESAENTNVLNLQELQAEDPEVESHMASAVSLVTCDLGS